jgi:hypothetical protein
MKKRNLFMLAGLLASGMTFSETTSAFAWGCNAVANDGTYGYSYNYPNKRGAMARARAECEARTYRRCRVVSCDPNG